jgi:transcriptional regulator with GAF, ATPase, and Fis domain
MQIDFVRLTDALAAPDQPQSVLRQLDTLLAQAIGHRLITVLQVTRDGQRMRRLYTNNPDAYPVGGLKPVANSQWTERVLRSGQPFLGRNSGDIRQMLQDHELIASLGLGSIINMPIVYDGRTLGALNILEVEGYYTPEHLEKVRPYSAFVVPGLLLAELDS